MARGEEDTSISQAMSGRLGPQESPTASNLVAAMSVEELRFFCQGLADISLKLSVSPTIEKTKEK